MSAGARFRQALEAERPLQIVGTINAYSALLAGKAGFRAIYLSGAGVANASFGPGVSSTCLSHTSKMLSPSFFHVCSYPEESAMSKNTWRTSAWSADTRQINSNSCPARTCGGFVFNEILGTQSGGACVRIGSWQVREA